MVKKSKGRRYMPGINEWNKLENLFNFDGTQKTGEDYRNALLATIPPRTRSEYPLTIEEINSSLTITELKNLYPQFRDLKFSCTLCAKPYDVSDNHGLIGGNLVIEDFASKELENLTRTHKGVVYALVEHNGGHVLKIGGTPTTSFTGRLGTYGNGRVHLRMKGSGTVTNYRAVQSAFANNIKYDVYIAYIDNKPEYRAMWYNEEISVKQNGDTTMEVKAKETKLTELYARANNGVMPPLNKQKGAK